MRALVTAEVLGIIDTVCAGGGVPLPRDVSKQWQSASSFLNYNKANAKLVVNFSGTKM